MSNALAFRFVESIERRNDARDFATMADLNQREVNLSSSNHQNQAQPNQHHHQSIPGGGSGNHMISPPPSTNEINNNHSSSTGGNNNNNGVLFSGMQQLHLQQNQQQNPNVATAAAPSVPSSFPNFFRPFSLPAGFGGGIQLSPSSGAYVDSLQSGASGIYTASSHFFNPQSQNSSLAGAQSGTFNNSNSVNPLSRKQSTSIIIGAGSSSSAATTTNPGSFTEIIQNLHLQSHQQEVYQQLQIYKEDQMRMMNNSNNNQNQNQQQQNQSQVIMATGSTNDISSSNNNISSSSNIFYNHQFTPQFANHLYQASHGPTTTAEVYALACEKYGCGTNTGVARQLVDVDVEHVEWISEHHERFHKILLELNEQYSSSNNNNNDQEKAVNLLLSDKQKEELAAEKNDVVEKQMNYVSNNNNNNNNNSDDDEENGPPMAREVTEGVGNNYYNNNTNTSNNNSVNTTIYTIDENQISHGNSFGVASTQAPANTSFNQGANKDENNNTEDNNNNNNNNASQTLTPMTGSGSYLPLRRQWRPVTLDDIHQILKQDSDETYIELVSSAAIGSNQVSQASFSAAAPVTTTTDGSSNSNNNDEPNNYNNNSDKTTPPSVSSDENSNSSNNNLKTSSSSREHLLRKMSMTIQQNAASMPSFLLKPHGAIRPLVTVFDLGNRNILNALSLRAFLDVCIICFPNLTRLIIGDVNLDEAGIKVLSESVSKMPKLASIDLRGNRNLFASSARLLVQTVEQNPNILELRMDSESVPNRILSALKIAIATNTAKKCPIGLTARKRKQTTTTARKLPTIISDSDAPLSSPAPSPPAVTATTEEEEDNNNNNNIHEEEDEQQQQQQQTKSLDATDSRTTLLLDVNNNNDGGASAASFRSVSSNVEIHEHRAEADHRRTFSADQVDAGEDPGAGCFSATVSLRPHPPKQQQQNNNNNRNKSGDQPQQQQDEDTDDPNNNTMVTVDGFAGSLSNDEMSSSPHSIRSIGEDDDGMNKTNSSGVVPHQNQNHQYHQQQQQQAFKRRKFLPTKSNDDADNSGHFVNNNNDNNNTNNSSQQHQRLSIVKDCIFRIGYSAIQLSSDLGDELFEKEFAKKFLLNSDIVADEIRPVLSQLHNNDTSSNNNNKNNINSFEHLLERLEQRRQYLHRTAKHLEARINLNNDDAKKSLFDLNETDLIVTHQLFKRLYLLLEPWRIERKSILRHAQLLWNDKQEEQKNAVYLATRPNTKESTRKTTTRQSGGGGGSTSRPRSSVSSPVTPLPDQQRNMNNNSSNNNETADNDNNNNEEEDELLDESLLEHFAERRKLEEEIEQENNKVLLLQKQEQQEQERDNNHNEKSSATRHLHRLQQQDQQLSYEHCEDPEQDFPTSNRSLGVSALREAAKLLNAIRNKVLSSVVFGVSLNAKRILFNDPVLRSSSVLVTASSTGRSSTADLRGYVQCTGEWPDSVKINHNNNSINKNNSNNNKSPSSALMPPISTKEGIAARVQILEDYLIEKHVKISRRIVLLHDRMKYLEHEYKNMINECTDRYRSVTPFPFVVDNSCSSTSNNKTYSSNKNNNNTNNTQNYQYQQQEILLQRENDSVSSSSYAVERRELFKELFSLFPSTLVEFFLELFTSRIVTRWQNMQDVTDVMFAMNSKTSSSSKDDKKHQIHLLNFVAEDILKYQKQQDEECFAETADDQQDDESGNKKGVSSMSKILRAENHNKSDDDADSRQSERSTSSSDNDDQEEDEEDLITGFSKKSTVRGTGGLLPISFVDSLLPPPKTDLELNMKNMNSVNNSSKNHHKYIEADLFDMIKRCLADEEAIRRTVVAVVCRKALKDVLGE